mgnify:CR=1 FL=1
MIDNDAYVNVIALARYLINLKLRGLVMKARALIVIDLDVEGFIEAAGEQQKIQDAVDSLVKNNKRVVWHGVDMKERRGDSPPDLGKMKFRSN